MKVSKQLWAIYIPRIATFDVDLGAVMKTRLFPTRRDAREFLRPLKERERQRGDRWSFWQDAYPVKVTVTIEEES